MNAYTVSRLALDAGVSVHIVRDYLLRGLLRPVACTTGGYRRRCQSDPSDSALVFAFLPNKLLETKSKAPRTIAISARLKTGQCQSRQ